MDFMTFWCSTSGYLKFTCIYINHLHKSKTWKAFCGVVESFLLCGLVSNIEKHHQKCLTTFPETFFLDTITIFLEKLPHIISWNYIFKHSSLQHSLKLLPGHLLSTPSDVPSTVFGWKYKELCRLKLLLVWLDSKKIIKTQSF